MTKKTAAKPERSKKGKKDQADGEGSSVQSSPRTRLAAAREAADRAAKAAQLATDKAAVAAEAAAAAKEAARNVPDVELQAAEAAAAKEMSLMLNCKQLQHPDVELQVVNQPEEAVATRKMTPRRKQLATKIKKTPTKKTPTKKTAGTKGKKK